MIVVKATGVAIRIIGITTPNKPVKFGAPIK